MRQLWAPWRLSYVAGPREPGCVFCQVPQAGDDRAALIVHRGELVYVLLNRYPYNSGHLMVVPFRHVARLDQLSADEAEALIRLTGQAIAGLERAMAAEGFNVGLNLGRAAGAGIEDHLHVHVVPRWAGDTNFMPVLGDTKVLPQHLDETYSRVAEALAAITRSERR
ncbi:MAG: HIT domain-containing protein [Armatimonadota bacterium]|nr:HIT domain-containing protein [Armatimonadota bacterium]